MRTLFIQPVQQGNSAGAATEVFQNLVFLGTQNQGDRILVEYLVNITATSFSIDLIIDTTSLGLSGFVQGDNIIRGTLIWQGASTAYSFEVINNTSTTLITGNVGFGGIFNRPNNDIHLLMQDTSGSPATNSILALFGSGVLIPAIS